MVLTEKAPGADRSGAQRLAVRGDGRGADHRRGRYRRVRPALVGRPGAGHGPRSVLGCSKMGWSVASLVGPGAGTTVYGTLGPGAMWGGCLAIGALLLARRVAHRRAADLAVAA